MGYTIRIGRQVDIEVAEAPKGPFGRTNYRAPSYLDWSDWIGAVPEVASLFDELGMYRSLTGDRGPRTRLRKRHLAVLQAALVLHPKDERLRWFAWWVGWALDNLNTPCFYAD